MRFHWHGTLPKIITSENPKPMPDEDEDEIAMWAAEPGSTANAPFFGDEGFG